VLRSDAARWGHQLRLAGVDVNLAPVLDTVPPGDTDNPPIGDLDREFGHTPRVVSRHGIAVVRGLNDAGVAATVKHFPGLGRVTGNTDTTSGVVDGVTSWNDPYLTPFQHAVAAGTPLVMMSTAIYTRLDPHNPAAFSRRIVTRLLRDRLGFGGVVISDDVGHAAQVSGYRVGARAVRFVAAGGDIVLTVDASQAGVMTAALARRARRSPAFAAQLDQAVTRVLRLKQHYGVLG
jgi:beta-N-acetylhexosaminidase